MKFYFSIDNIPPNIVSCGDFFTYIGMLDYFKEHKEKHFSISQVKTNGNTLEHLYTILLENLKKDKRFREYSNKYIENSFAMDWLNYAPVKDVSIPDGEVWLIEDNS